MTTITIEEAQAKLPELIGGLARGEELVITEDGEPVATLTRSERGLRPRKAGSAKDKILWISPDFDAPLEEFREYME
jgi:antitoxin (DNA-binding transcriptional repressor) of toxin-antitoxin stability system